MLPRCLWWRQPTINAVKPCGRGGVRIAQNYLARSPQNQKARINNNIRAREVRVIDPDGNQIGVMPVPQALSAAQEFGLDLVEVSPNAKPPVCKIMDYGRYKYEQTKKQHEAKKKQATFQIP